MRVVNSLLFGTLLVAGSAMAADQPDPAPYRLKLSTPEATMVGTVQTDPQATPTPSVPVASSAAPISGQGSGSAQAAAGVPLIGGGVAPASTETVPPPSQADAGQAPQLATSPAGIRPGEPVKVYSTIQEAAAAGVDPLGERKPSPEKKAPVHEKAAFDWKDPQAYLALVQEHQSHLIQAVGGLLVAGLILWLLRRRRG